MNNFDYKNMTPFKWFVLENFPFIENDFEAINNYQLFSKVVEYLNKTIDNVNVLGNLVEQFSNYFDNLDVQEEINNKLDEMAEDGTLENIINQEIFGEITGDIVVAIGDSYSINNTGWGSLLCTYLGKTNNVDFFLKGEGASGLTVKGHNNHKFLDLLNLAGNDISSDDKPKVKKVIMLGFYNDRDADSTTITNAFATFKNRVIELFPNATLYVGCIAGNNVISSDATNIRNKILANCNLIKKLCLDNQAIYLTNSELVLKNYTLYDNTNYHPNLEGCQNIAKMVVSNLKGCSYKFPYTRSLVQLSDAKNITSSFINNFAYESINENVYTLFGSQDITYTTEQTVSTSQGLYLGTMSNQKYLRPINEQYLQRFNAVAQITSNGVSYCIGGYILINPSGEYYFYANRSYGQITNVHIYLTGMCSAQYV